MANKLDSLFFFGRPFSPLYGLVMRIREQLYTKQVFTQHKVAVPVISVGNLVLGGTGKTPTVIFLAKLLQRNGYRPAVVSRGYGGKSKEDINIVSDGKSLLMDTVEAGDEPVLLASTLNGVVVLTGKKRILPCEYAVQQFGVDCIILDDGFQHMGVSRDINLVLFDAGNLAGNSRVFPAGPLREPVSSLHRTTAFLITGKTDSNSERSHSFVELLQSKFVDVPVFTAANTKPTLHKASGEPVALSEVKNATLFCAIANPERVSQTAEDLGITIIHTSFFQDHKEYTQQIVNSLCEDAKGKGAHCLITTTKDFVKVNNFKFDLPIYILQVEQQPEDSFTDFILKNISNNR